MNCIISLDLRWAGCPFYFFCWEQPQVFFLHESHQEIIVFEGWWFDSYMMQPLVFSTPTQKRKHPWWGQVTFICAHLHPPTLSGHWTPGPLAERSCLSLWDILSGGGYRIIHGSLGCFLYHLERRWCNMPPKRWRTFGEYDKPRLMGVEPSTFPGGVGRKSESLTQMT